jgi:ubiquinone/menaquinone biosynthesis C-methylase UbiE
MARSREEQELSERFADEYNRAQSPVMLDLERAVCGCDYGGTSWTTRDEAEQMGRLLGLAEGRTLLEIGAGSGWPALFLARETGCDATLVDVPHDALRIAADRVASESPKGEISLVVADGAALPFQSGLFDAVSHSDVLCCLARKLDVLDECRRVIRHVGMMVFSVISIAPGLSRAKHARAVDFGPPYVETGPGYPELLEKTGWKIIEQMDVSATYEETGRCHLREMEALADGMSELLGESEFAEMLVRRRRSVESIADRIVRRDLFVVSPF